ncbi:hypothetical protein BCR43DRAFT_539079 [Syncephalastrum racemosum]|uniref:Uncharacterized protein n=1 Tax=Syncephalastrum racemosum TaxID=13706 RepID=A0A1X2H079_SYNRA|nr:hypothetical protein BCR43DRAFT_539079 [Syncephalastrum racemosum]
MFRTVRSREDSLFVMEKPITATHISDTLALAAFLATTGPEESTTKKKTFLQRLRKKSSAARPTLRTHHTNVSKPKHVALPAYVPSSPPAPPQYPPPPPQSIKTDPHPHVEEEEEPHDSGISLVEEFPKPPPSPILEDCPNCHHALRRDQKRSRRISCPAAIVYTEQPQNEQPPQPPQQAGDAAPLSSQEAQVLLSMIEQLQSQLMAEQQSRKRLESILARADEPITPSSSYHATAP